MTSALNYASCNVKVDSLTFIYFQENYQTAEIYDDDDTFIKVSKL